MPSETLATTKDWAENLNLRRQAQAGIESGRILREGKKCDRSHFRNWALDA